MLGTEGFSLTATVPQPLPIKPGATVKGTADAKLKDMAKEMESTFLSMLLKEMRQTLDPEGGLFPGDSADVQGGLFDLYMSKHLADGGGVGLAAALVRQMQAGAAPKTPHTTDALPPPTPITGAYTPSAPRK